VYAPGAGYPELPAIRSWLKVAATVLPDAELELIAGAEQRAQRELVWTEGDLPEDAPDDVVAAFMRRCARHAAAKGLPTGIIGADAEYGAVRLARFDVEIERLEAPYVAPVIA
jgi:hypothetical protein